METHISSQRRQDSITQRDAALAPLQQRLSARQAKERQQRHNNQNCVFFSS
jgi:hypothetical protein